MKLIQTQCLGKCPNCVGNKYLLQAVCLISRVLRYIIFAWIGRDVPFEKVQEQRPECDALGLSTRSHALGQLCLHHLDSSTDTWLGKNPLKPQIVGHSIMKRRPSPRTLLRSCEQWGGFTKTRGWPLRVSMGPWYVFVMYVCIYIYIYIHMDLYYIHAQRHQFLCYSIIQTRKEQNLQYEDYDPEIQEIQWCITSKQAGRKALYKTQQKTQPERRTWNQT